MWQRHETCFIKLIDQAFCNYNKAKDEATATAFPVAAAATVLVVSVMFAASSNKKRQ